MHGPRTANFTHERPSRESSSTPNSPCPWPARRRLCQEAALQCPCGHLLPPPTAPCCHTAAPSALNDHSCLSLRRKMGAASRSPTGGVQPAMSQPWEPSRFAARLLRPHVDHPRSGILRARLTRSLASKEAPRSRSSAAVALWPPAAAFISAVLPYCGATCPQRPQPLHRGMRRAPPPARRTPA